MKNECHHLVDNYSIVLGDESYFILFYDKKYPLAATIAEMVLQTDWAW